MSAIQHEITRSAPLLKENGELTEPGYAKRLLPQYRRDAIKAGKLRIKEWDYYLITSGEYALALTIADNSYMGLASVSFLDFRVPEEKTVSPMRFFTLGKTGLPSSSERGNVSTRGRGYALSFEKDGDRRILTLHMNKFKDKKPIDGRVVLTEPPSESMVIATPFDKPGHFYFNQKINCMPAEGEVTVADERFAFEPSSAFGVLDWGRGVWTYKNTWYWGSASGLADGVPFGFNIGYGFGNTSAASENMIFYDHKAHKLSQVTFNIPMKDGVEDYLSPWTFSSDDGRFEMTFMPIIDRASDSNVLLIRSNQHQVFGRFTGCAVLDDGKRIEIRDFLGFAEKVYNKW